MKTTNQLNKEKAKNIDRAPQGKQQVDGKGLSRSWRWMWHEECFHYLSRVIWALRTGTLTADGRKDCSGVQLLIAKLQGTSRQRH